MKTTLISTCFMMTMLSGLAQTNYNHKTLTVFKNGLVYLEKATEVDVQNKQAVLYPLPFSSDQNTPIVIGSLQLKATDNSINALEFTKQEVGKDHPSYYEDMYALFKNNIGASIEIYTKENTIKGVLKNIMERKLMVTAEDQIHFISIDLVDAVNFIKKPKAAIDKEKEKTALITMKLTYEIE